MEAAERSLFGTTYIKHCDTRSSAMTGTLLFGDTKYEVQYGIHQHSPENKYPNFTGHGGGLIRL